MVAGFRHNDHLPHDRAGWHRSTMPNADHYSGAVQVSRQNCWLVVILAGLRHDDHLTLGKLFAAYNKAIIWTGPRILLR